MPNNNNRETSAADTAALREELERLSRRERRGYRCAKRIFDILFSAAALLCLSPVLLFLAVLIFLDDPHGSPIYVQTRIGRDRSVYINSAVWL